MSTQELAAQKQNSKHSAVSRRDGASPPVTAPAARVRSSLNQNAAPATVDQRQAIPGGLAFDHLLIASGGCDDPPADIRDWLMPLLRGLDAGSWAACVLNLAIDDCMSARFFDGRSGHEHLVASHLPARDAARLRQRLPGLADLTVVMLDNCSSQVFTLLDAVADWVLVLDPRHDDFACLTTLFAAFRLLSTGGVLAQPCDAPTPPFTRIRA